MPLEEGASSLSRAMLVDGWPGLALLRDRADSLQDGPMEESCSSCRLSMP
jgi:hypothetical protein